MRQTLAVVFAAALTCSPLYAQLPSPARTAPRDLGAIATHDLRTPVDDMKDALRDLVEAEEKFFYLRHAYTTDRGLLEIDTSSRSQPEIEMISAGKSSWSARAKVPAFKGKSCVIYVGPVKELPHGPPKTATGISAKREGVAACDEP
jgi:hypothetical protein